MTSPLSDADALALYDRVWPNEREGHYYRAIANAVRSFVAAPNLDAAVETAQSMGYDSADPYGIRARILELRRLAGIDDDAGLVERMAITLAWEQLPEVDFEHARGGPDAFWAWLCDEERAIYRKMARAALAVVREEEGI